MAAGDQRPMWKDREFRKPTYFATVTAIYVAKEAEKNLYATFKGSLRTLLKIPI